MGKKWDYDVPSIEIWKEALRVLKPGGTALIFAGSRTQHRMAVNVEDAGFILKDCIMWLYGSGFPKATDISKQIDKRNGRYLEIQKEIGLHIKEKREEKGFTIEQVNKFCNRSSIASLWESQKDKWSRLPCWKDWEILKKKLSVDKKYDEIIKRIEAERDITGKGKSTLIHDKGMDGNFTGEIAPKEYNITEPATPEAKLWNGWKSHGLKPAYEPILVAVKPNDGTYANNALTWGVSGLNIDGGRIEGKPRKTGTKPTSEDATGSGNTLMGSSKNRQAEYDAENKGRFPANIILDEEAGKMLDKQSGELKSGARKKQPFSKDKNLWNKMGGGDCNASKGGASRFFYCAKASKSERNAGLDCYLTVKYNECISNNKNLCKEENMGAVQLLKKVISDMGQMNFSTGESGENIMVQCHKDSLSTTLMEINKIIESRTYSLLMHLHTNGFTQDVKLEMENGGSLAESVENLKKYLLTITKGNQELALGANSVALKMLSLIKEEENWKPSKNFHSTVKPLKLMEYLCILTKTPTGGVVLDMFAGSGTTGVACKNTDRDFIGIELDPEYIKIAEARINNIKDKQQTLI